MQKTLKGLFTSEQVSAGHPDKICDQISDAIVTDCLRNDKASRVAAECLIKDYEIIVAGEITSARQPDFKAVAQGVLKRIGVPDAGQYHVTALISQQSPDIALGVDADGAGDQGVIFGYATDETAQLLPIPYVLACDALERLARLKSPMLLPDAKCQVTYDYDRERIDTFLISTQHSADADLKDVRATVQLVMEQTAQAHHLNTDFRVLVNPTGRFVVGGSFADTGLTGGNIIADTYGGMCRRRRRRVQREGSDQDRPQRRVHGAKDRQRYRSRRFRKALRGSACLRHRQSGTRIRCG